MKTLTALLVIFGTGAGLMLIVYLGSLDSPSTSVSPTIADDIVCLRRNVDGLPCLVCTRTEIVAPGGYKVWINSIAIDCDWRAETSIHLPE